jgi:aminoglycoside 6'-N-acetyltransferase I
MNSPERDPTALAPSKFVIEDLRHGDTHGIEQAAALLVGAFPRWTATLDAARDEVAEVLRPGHVCLTAKTGKSVLGWIGAIPSYSHAWELHPLVVREDVRGRSIGRALVAALEEQVRLRGALTLYLGTDDDGPVPGTSAGGVDLFPGVASHAANLVVVDHAAGFYRRLGFEVVGLIPDANGPGKPEVLLAKRIGSGQ